MKGILSAFIFSFIMHTAVNAENAPYYFETVANSGDGVYSLLRKYKLLDYYCNIQAFYELNALSKDDVLLAGKKYKLPVLIYPYNGISIRSTINDQDWEKAIRIKTYNETIHAEGLRTKTFTESRILWVPHHELNCNQQKNTEEAEKERNSSSSNGIPGDSMTTEIDRKSDSSNAGQKMVPLFGPDFELVNLFDESLKNKAFYIVSGHGGPDPGAMCTTCPSSLCEDEYA
jgi:N-acetylmuramoyl-L-alanine amidase